MKTVSIAEAKASFAALVDEIATTHEVVRITRPGRPSAVLISEEDFRSLHRELTALSRQDRLRALGQAQSDFRAGNAVAGDDLRRRFGLDV